MLLNFIDLLGQLILVSFITISIIFACELVQAINREAKKNE